MLIRKVWWKMKEKILFKILVLTGLCFSLTLMSCPDGDSETPIDYSIAEAQLHKDYSTYTIGNIAWSTQRNYQVAKFSIMSKPITAWYELSGRLAIREMDCEDLGTTVPAIIKAAFDATPYSNTSLWVIEEIELEHNYKATGVESYYEMELQNLTNSNLEAKLFFDGITGVLLYSKEDFDDDDDDDDIDDTFVINDQLKAAVEAAVPGAQIIDAEVDDNLIEVGAIVTVNGIKQEIELNFSMNYMLVSKEIETEYVYSALPANFAIIKTWLTNHPSTAPIPPANTQVEITEGNQVEDDNNVGRYYYELEIDEYTSGANEYEFEFYLSEEFNIIAVILNDSKQP